MQNTSIFDKIQSRISLPTTLGILVSFGVMTVILRLRPDAIGGILVVLFFLLGAFFSAYVVKEQGVIKPRHFIIPLMVATILLPPIRIPGPIPSVRFDLLIILFAWGLKLGNTASSGQPLILRHQHINKWFGIFGLAIICSMTYATLVKGYPFLFRDAFELVKLFKYFLIFSFVASLKISYKDFQRYCTVALVVFLLSALFGFAQYLNLFNINASVSPYYAPTQMRGLLVHGRITGTTGNPNQFGALMVFAATLALSLALFSEKRKVRTFSWCCIPAFCLAVFLTLSRSSVIILVGAFSLVLLMRYPVKIKTFMNNSWKLLTIFLVLALFGIVLVSLAPDKFVARIDTLRSFTSQASWQVRLLKWSKNLEIWKESMIFGWGPGKAGMTTIVDSEWVLLLRRYGIIGLSIFFLWFTSAYRYLGKMRRRFLRFRCNPTFVGLTVVLQAMFLAYAIFMIPAGVYHDLQSMPIVFLFLGLVYSQRNKESLVNGCFLSKNRRTCCSNLRKSQGQ